MSTYIDFTPYKYSLNFKKLADKFNLVQVSVGWLGKDSEFKTFDDITKTALTDEVMNALLELCCKTRAQMRGWHDCELCDKEVTKTGDYRKVYFDKNEYLLGSGEMGVACHSFLMVAPNLIYHYITKHNYLPPDVFIEGIKNHIKEQKEAKSNVEQYFSGTKYR